MPLLQLQAVTLRYGAAPLLDAVDFQVDPGERVCLLGRNGTGKTSLMRILAGEEPPNSGNVIQQPGTFMTRLPQEIPENICGTVHQVIESGLRHDHHEEQWQSDLRIEELIAEMKLPAAKDFSALSGGLKRRVLLARAMAGQPDLLLLDEPTNHLDLDSILWLEEFLLTHKATFFFVTHDRAFLRKLATRIVELDRGKLSSWQCDYDTYLIRRAAVLDAEEKQRAAFDKKLAIEETWLRQGIKARRTRNEGRVKALEAMRRERRAFRNREETARIGISDGTLSGQKVIETKNVSFAYSPDATPIIRDFSDTIWRGDKIGIIGPNGGGKTTLLKLLLGKLEPTSGEVKAGTRLQIVYLDQLRAQIDDDKTIAQNVAGDAENVTFQGRSRHIHSYLQDFLFRGDCIRMPAKMLSGGERNRLLLARLFLQPANVLVLDEPTNDLDAETMELLEEILVEFSGTLLLVSHDRAFLDNVVTSTLVFEGDGVVKDYIGGYQDWVSQRAAVTAKTPTTPVQEKSPPTPGQQPKEKPKPFLKREQRELDELPSRIEALETRQKEIAAKLWDPELYQKEPESIPKLKTELENLERQTSEAYARWEDLEARCLAASQLC